MLTERDGPLMKNQIKEGIDWVRQGERGVLREREEGEVEGRGTEGVKEREVGERERER